MDNPLNPDQKKQVKKVKVILWLSLLIIIIIGLAIMVYFVFLKTETVDTNNENKNTNTAIDTSNWSMYINAQYGFGFRYPVDWTLTEDDENDIVNLSYKNTYYIYFTYQGTNPDHLSIKEWLNRTKFPPDNYDYELEYDQQSGISITGLEPGIYQGAVTFYFMVEDNIFRIEWFDNNKEDLEVFNIVNKIVTSIEFIDATENCLLITDRNECEERQDCLPVDICECTTKYEWSKRCGIGDTLPCLCVTGGFGRCVELMCEDTAELFNGTVSLTCESDLDCALVNNGKNFSGCCPTPSCIDYSLSTYIAVNEVALNMLIDEAQEPCQRKDLECPEYESVICKETNNSNYSSKCISGICHKAFSYLK